jgi:hypothetical protein
MPILNHIVYCVFPIQYTHLQEVLLKTRGFFVSQLQLSQLHAEERATGVGQTGGSYQTDEESGSTAGYNASRGGGSLNEFRAGT